MAAELISDDYRHEQAALVADPIVQAMAKEVEEHELRDSLFHEDGTPRFAFMLRANSEYRRRSGKESRSLGGVARAIGALAWRS
jgi:hypothetical protein